MFPCPAGCGPLQRQRTPKGWLWVCPTCEGRAATVDLLQGLVDERAVGELWVRGREAEREGRGCPSCHRPMATVPVGEPAVAVDVCPPCRFAWFDRGELAALPQPAAATPKPALPPEAAQALAMAQVDRIRRDADAVPEAVSPVRWLPTLFGLPIEVGSPALRRLPLTTWGVAIAVAAISVVAFGDLLPWVQAWGLDAGAPLRRGGSTLLTHALLHGSWLHLLGNLYFLLTFGDNVEDLLGRRRFAALLAASIVAGGLAHVATAPAGIPLIGISGGTSGLLLLYALAFPRVRLGLLVWFRPVTLPVWAWVVFWFGLQVVGAAVGGGPVAYASHVAGALVGVAAFFGSDLRRLRG